MHTAACHYSRPKSFAGCDFLDYGFHSCRRYGLIGPNGCGKSSLLKALGKKELDIPDHIDVYHLDREIDATDMTALEAVTSVDEEKAKLEAEAEKLVELPDDPDAQIRLEDIYERCARLSPP